MFLAGVPLLHRASVAPSRLAGDWGTGYLGGGIGDPGPWPCFCSFSILKGQ